MKLRKSEMINPAPMEMVWMQASHTDTVPLEDQWKCKAGVCRDGTVYLAPEEVVNSSDVERLIKDDDIIPTTIGPMGHVYISVQYLIDHHVSMSDILQDAVDALLAQVQRDYPGWLEPGRPKTNLQ